MIVRLVNFSITLATLRRKIRPKNKRLTAHQYEKLKMLKYYSGFKRIQSHTITLTTMINHSLGQYNEV